VITQTKKGHPCLPGRGLAREGNNHTSVKLLLLRSLIMDAGWIIVIKDQRKFVRTEMARKYVEGFAGDKV